MEWIIYEKTVSLRNYTVSLTLIERKETPFWLHKIFTVTFNKNTNAQGSSEAVPKFITIKYNENYLSALPFPPTRPNYNFSGWNTRADGSGKVFDTKYLIEGNMTVYAHWEKITEPDYPGVPGYPPVPGYPSGYGYGYYYNGLGFGGTGIGTLQNFEGFFNGFGVLNHFEWFIYDYFQFGGTGAVPTAQASYYNYYSRSSGTLQNFEGGYYNQYAAGSGTNYVK